VWQASPLTTTGEYGGRKYKEGNRVTAVLSDWTTIATYPVIEVASGMSP
jgi:hypothetical protein